MNKTRLQRLMERALPEPNSGCWLWMGSCNNDGYGQIESGWPQRTNEGAHRVAYEELVGPIADGLVIDHLCRMRSCVNPLHLEPVTVKENIRRGLIGVLNKPHCPQGHLFDEANTVRVGRAKYRGCRICRTRRLNARRSKKRALARAKTLA